VLTLNNTPKAAAALFVTALVAHASGQEPGVEVGVAGDPAARTIIVKQGGRELRLRLDPRRADVAQPIVQRE
jgi:hypothetical protein